jgi:hypothetical protein
MLVSRERMERMCPLLVQSGAWAGDGATTTSGLLQLVSGTLPQLQQQGYWTHSFRADNPYYPHQYAVAIAQHRALGHGMLIEICTRLEVSWLLTCVCMQPDDRPTPQSLLLRHAAAAAVLIGPTPPPTSHWMPPEKVAFMHVAQLNHKRRRASDTDTTRRLVPYHAIVQRHRDSHQPVSSSVRSVLAEDYATQLRTPMRATWTALRIFTEDIQLPRHTLSGWLLRPGGSPPLPNRASGADLQVLQEHEAIQRSAINDTLAAFTNFVDAVRVSYDRSVWLWLQFRRLLAAGEHDTLRFLLDEPIAVHSFNFHFTTLGIALNLLFGLLCDGGWQHISVTRHVAAVAHNMLS